MKILTKDLITADFAIGAMQRTENKTVKQSYWIDRIISAIEKDIAIYYKAVESLKKKHCKVDENGKYLAEGEELSFLTKKDREEFEKGVNSLYEQEIDINWDPISIDIFDGMNYNGPTYGLRFFFTEAPMPKKSK